MKALRSVLDTTSDIARANRAGNLERLDELERQQATATAGGGDRGDRGGGIGLAPDDRRPAGEERREQRRVVAAVVHDRQEGAHAQIGLEAQSARE